MKTPAALARPLLAAAAATPAALALRHGERHWSFAELVAETRALAAGFAGEAAPLCLHGNSLALAQHAYACGFENRPFFPVDRDNRPDFPATGPDDLALIIATSGSEGQARCVMLGSRQLDAAALAANRLLALGPGDLWLNCLPLYHIGGQAILWRCAHAGAAVLLHEGFAAEAVAADLAHHAVTHLSLVPAMLARLLDTGAKPPPSLRHVLIGGAALAPALYERAMLAGWPLNPSYGMSETAAQIATWLPENGPWQPGAVGRPMPGHEIALTADGRIRIRGPQVMIAYLDDRGVDAEGWFTTGDLGHIDQDGCLTVLGRADDMLISGGRNVHPLTIEACLAACPGVDDIAVTGLPDPVWGDLIVALVVGPADLASLREWSATRLPGAAQPRRIVRLPALPRNAAGKLARNVLRDLAREGGA